MRDSDFFLGYIEALFFTECHPSHAVDEWDEVKNVVERLSIGDGNIPFDAYPEDFDEDTLTTLREECEKFQEENKELLTVACNHLNYSEKQAGRDFWLTRNRHGAGYWDREELKGELGAALTKATEKYRELNAFWHENKIYVY